MVKAVTVQNGDSGFRTWTICPFNANTIPDHIFIQPIFETILNNDNLTENDNDVNPNDTNNIYNVTADKPNIRVSK